MEQGKKEVMDMQRWSEGMAMGTHPGRENESRIGGQCALEGGCGRRQERRKKGRNVPGTGTE